MKIAVQPIAWFDTQTTDLDFATHVDHVRIAMRNGNMAGKKIKTGGLDFRQITDGSIGHRAHASQLPQQLRMHLAERPR